MKTLDGKWLEITHALVITMLETCILVDSFYNAQSNKLSFLSYYRVKNMVLKKLESQMARYDYIWY